MQIAPSQDQRATEEARLWRAWREDADATARSSIFERYVGLAKRIAQRRHHDHKSSSIEFNDLCQLAYVGLLEAIDRFDPEVGVSFARYAERRISGSILDGLRRMSEVREQVSFRNRIAGERTRLLATPADGDRVPESAFERLVDLAVGLALGFILEGTGLYVCENGAGEAPNVYGRHEWDALRRKLSTLVESLPDRERFVLKGHYVDGIDFDGLARALSLSKGRVSQIHRNALDKLRSQMAFPSQFSPPV